MDYLRRYHAADVETMALVAKHFSMHREWALHLEHSARTRLQPMRGKTIPSEFFISAMRLLPPSRSLCFRRHLFVCFFVSLFVCLLNLFVGRITQLLS